MNPFHTIRSIHRHVLVVLAFEVTVLVTAGCGKDNPTAPKTGGRTPVVVTPPVAQFGASRTEGDLPVVVAFTNQSTGDVASRKWDFDDGTAASTDESPTHTFNAIGRHVVRLTLTGSDGSVSSSSCEIIVNRLVTVHTAPLRLGPFWPAHQSGDCDFGGHGPQVDADAHFAISANGQQLLLYPHMRAVETRPDRTTAESSFNPVPIVTLASGGMRIKAILGPTSSSVSYESSGHSYNNRAGSTSMASFSILGDTDGNDVCNTTSDDTQMYVWVYDYTYRVGP